MSFIAHRYRLCELWRGSNNSLSSLLLTWHLMNWSQDNARSLPEMMSRLRNCAMPSGLVCKQKLKTIQELRLKYTLHCFGGKIEKVHIYKALKKWQGREMPTLHPTSCMEPIMQKMVGTDGIKIAHFHITTSSEGMFNMFNLCKILLPFFSYTWIL